MSVAADVLPLWWKCSLHAEELVFVAVERTFGRLLRSRARRKCNRCKYLLQSGRSEPKFECISERIDPLELISTSRIPKRTVLFRFLPRPERATDKRLRKKVHQLAWLHWARGNLNTSDTPERYRLKTAKQKLSSTTQYTEIRIQNFDRFRQKVEDFCRCSRVLRLMRNLRMVHRNFKKTVEEYSCMNFSSESIQRCTKQAE